MTLVERHGFTFLKEKGDAFEKFREFKVYAEKQYGAWIKCLRIDGGL